MAIVVTLARFVRLGRPHFLAGGVIFYALGAVLAVYPRNSTGAGAGQALDTTAWLWGQAAVTCVQWMTHYANDYFDLPVDRANRTPTH